MADPIAAARKVDWTTSGVSGGIVIRSTVFTTLNPGATAAQIVSAMASCPAGQVVRLSAGTFNVTGIELVNADGKTLRGAGPNLTTLVFAMPQVSGFGRPANLYIRNNNTVHPGFAANLTDWTAGYVQGTTVITLNSIANLAVGSIIILDQLDDTDTDTGEIWQARNIDVVSTEGDTSTGRTNRGQHQLVRVTAINGNQVTISPGLYMPNWRAGRSPQAYWSSGQPTSGVGIEGMTLDHSATLKTPNGAENGVTFFNAYGCWLRNVRSLNGPRSHVLVYQSKNLTLADSFFYGTQAAESQSYGIETYVAGDCRVENNIFHRVTVPVMQGGGSHGNAIVYNYSNDNFTTQASGLWMQGGLYHHNVGVNYSLFEGNDSNGFTADNVHGTSHFPTLFRNRLTGFETGKTLQTIAVHMYNANRYANVVGNVLGTVGYHTLYQKLAPSGTGAGDLAIYTLGWTGAGGTTDATHPALQNDALVASTMLRWGNYDTVTVGNRFVAGEVPSGLSLYANPVPPDQTLITSYVRASRPAYFDTIFGSVPWPPIGPDVTGGTLPSVGGHVYRIPARLVFENVAQADFNADTVVGGTNLTTTSGAAALAGTTPSRFISNVVRPHTVLSDLA